MRQAIETHFLGPTAHRGARVCALAQAGRVVIPWEHGLDGEENHRAALASLLNKLGWGPPDNWVGGSAPSNPRGYVWVDAGARQ